MKNSIRLQAYASAILLAGLYCQTAGGEERAADLIIVNAVVHTVDEAHPKARWIAIRDGRIEALGNAGPSTALRGPGTRVVDAHGKLVLPAFIDAHTHPVWGGLSHARCPLYEGNSLADYQKLIAQCAREQRDSPWIYGVGWQDGLFKPDGIPDKSLLDSIVPDRPAAFSSVGGHSLWLNSKALEAARITRNTPDPPHGRIDRDAQGEPVGGLQEAAVELVTSKLPPPSESERERALLYAIHYFNSVGIVGFHDALLPIRGEDSAQVIPPHAPDTYVALVKQGRLKAYATVALGWDRGVGLEQLAELKGAAERLASAGVQAQSVKFLLDGVPVQRTAALLKPYADKPEEQGALEVDPETLNKAVAALAQRGVQVHFHAIGDRAVRTALDAIEYAQRETHDALNRPLISHLNLVSPTDYPRFKALGAISIFQPLWACMDDYMRLVGIRVGPERMTHMYPTASLMRAGATVAYGSDWPVASANPFEGLEVAVTRRAPGATSGERLAPTERVGLAAAVRNYTLQSARALHVEDRSGSLTVGKNADLVAVDQDIFKIPPERISKTHVLVTMYRGEVVYGDFASL